MPGQGNGERDNVLADGSVVSERIPVYEAHGDRDVPERQGEHLETHVIEYDKPGTTYDLGLAKTHVYVSGPMSGYPDFNFAAFRRAAGWLRSQGYTVFSPHEQGWGNGDPSDGSTSEEEYLEFLREDIAQVAVSNMIVLLRGWENSRGANFELDVARRLGLEVRVFNDAGWLERISEPDPETVLAEADRLVAHDRAADYGHPLDDFGKVVGMARALWGRGPETEEEHAIYMVLVKIAREANRPKRDNRVDGPGYFKTLDMVIEERARRAKEEA